MWIYLVLIAILFAAALYIPFDREWTFRSKHLRWIRTSKDRMLVCALVLIALSGFRFETGTDHVYYIIHYQCAIDGTVSGSKFEAGYNLLNNLIAFFRVPYQVFFLILAGIMMVLVIKTILEFSEHREMSLFLFVALYFYLASFNTVRQFLAIPIVLYATRYLVEKRPVPYMMCVLIASTFHYTALVMVPFYFVANIRFKRWVHFVFLAAVFVFSFFGQPIIAAILKLFPRYAVYFDYESGSAWCDMIVMAVCYVLLLMMNKRGKEKPYYNLFVNAIVLGIAFSFMTRINLLFARIMPYFYIYSILVIPNSIRYSTVKNKKALTKGVCIIALAVYVYYLMNNNGGVVPYRIS